MSYELISESWPKARKEYNCIWCPEKINKGMQHIHEVSKYDGDFQDVRWHIECLSAFDEYYKATRDGEFDPHSHLRGRIEER